MDAVLDALERARETGLMPAGGSVQLAVSGGADSMALLFGCVEINRGCRTGWRLSVAHVHHGWPTRRRDADRDLAFVADHARRQGLAFHCRRRDALEATARLRLSPEAGARHVRYAALSDMARETGAHRTATAHHRDDAIESHVMARRRSGGLASLAGPRLQRDDGVVRPFLAVRRAEILRFLSDRGIVFRRDASNGDLALERNRVRRELRHATEEELAAIEAAVSGLVRRREALDADYAARIVPAASHRAETTIVDARFLAGCPEELRRSALSRLAAPYAREGRAPMTGRERERILALLAAGGDFRFEAGRRIRLERRRDRLFIRLRGAGSAGTVYDAGARTPSR